MSDKTAVIIKLDKKVRDEARKLARDLGVPFSTLINANLKNIIREGAIVLSRTPQIKESVWDELERASKDFASGKNISPGFTSAIDAFAWLNK